MIPNKYDIIPIHNSDRGSFRRCRQYWDWSSPARNNLSIRADVHGVNLPLFNGTGIHYALEQFYNPNLRRDPVESWKTWFDIMWRGGVVTEEWLPLVYDLEPQPQSTVKTSSVKTWKVRGLEDILPDVSQQEEFDEVFETGIKMMQFYKEYASVNDDFEVLLAEHNFSVPIWDYANDKILTAIDKREESPNYGKELEVHARGRVDAVKQRPNGSVGIIDHKTTARVDEDLPIKLETDEQCTTYLYCLEVEAMYYDLPHKGTPMEDVLYNVLRKAYPKPPTILKDGFSFSVNRQQESTTYDMLMGYINSFDSTTRNMLWPKFTPPQQAYIDYLREVGDEQFIIRKSVRRNKHQLANAGQRLYLEAMDMLADDVRIYPNLRNDYKCLNCQFRIPCLLRMDSGDAEANEYLKQNYAIQKDR